MRLVNRASSTEPIGSLVPLFREPLFVHRHARRPANAKYEFALVRLGEVAAL
jgi:hypothetical protein